MTEEQLEQLTINIESLNDLTTIITDTITNHENRILNNETRIMELEDQINVAGVNTELELPTILQGWSDALIEENIQFDSEGNLKVKKLEAKEINTEKMKVKQDNFIIEASSGTCFKVKVEDDGTLKSEAINCP